MVEPELGLAWVTVPPGAIERLGVSSDDLDGVVEFPRSIEGVRMALLFREVSQGRIKVSLRSVGDVDVAAFAKPFGGGGHTKAAGSRSRARWPRSRRRSCRRRGTILRRTASGAPAGG